MAARLVERIVSGGQTGVDRAALDAALALGVPCGGWCPGGRRAEDGPIAERYPLVETPSAQYAERTRLNVRDSDATLILTRGALTGGTALTADLAGELGRPVLVVDFADWEVAAALSAVRAWIDARAIGTLNLAGPRESTVPGIYAESLAFLTELLRR